MAYNTKKGSQHSGDIQYEGDPNDVQIDFENDQVSLMAGGAQRLTATSASVSISGSLSASADVVATGNMHAAVFYGSAAGLSGVPASSVTPAGSDTQIQFNNGGALGASSNLIWDDTNLKIVGNVSGSSTLQAVGAATLGNNLSVSGNITTSGITALMDFNCSENANAFRVRGADTEYFRVDTDSNLFYFRNSSKTRFGSHTAAPTHTVSVTGDISASSTLHACGATTLGDTLAVSGSSTLAAVNTTSLSSSGFQATSVEAASGQVDINFNVGTSGQFAPPGNAYIYNVGYYSGSGAFHNVSSMSSSGDLALSGTVHAAHAYVSGFLSGATVLGNRGQFAGADIEFDRASAMGMFAPAGQPFISNKGYYSGSAVFYNAGAISASADIYVTGAVSASQFFGDGASLSGISIEAGTLSGSGRIYSATGLETSGYLRVSGSSTLVGSTTLGGLMGAGTTITGTGSFSTIVATGSISGSGTLTITSLSASGESHFSGNVGIGTATPVYDLHINGPGYTVAMIDGGASSDAFLKFATNTVEKAYLKLGSGGNFILAQDATGGDLDLKAKPDGVSTTYLTLDGGKNTLDVFRPLSGSDVITAVGSISSSGDLAVTGAVHATTFYGSGVGLTGITVSALSGTTAELTTGVETSGYLKVSGSSTLAGVTATTISASSTLQVVGNAVFGGNTNVSGNIALQTTEPNIYFSGSDGTILGQIGYNSANNIVLQNNFNNQHVVLKTTDEGVIKEGLRLDGAVPEVVVNQNADSLVNFRVESNNNTHMLYIKGSTDKAGINTSDPKTDWDVHHNPTTLSNDTGGGEAVQFGTGTTVAGKLYYLHSGSSWEQTDMITAASGGLGMLAMALGTTPGTDGMLIRGFFDAHSYLSGTFAPGTTLYISAPGYITTMRPSGSAEILRVLGTCTTTANVIYFNPSPDYLVIT
jgi:hypothetical protein